MVRYVTTNLRFPEEAYRELQYEASRRGTSLASLVRESVDRYLGRAPEAEAPEFGKDPMDSWIGAITPSPGDESTNHDHYLYGWPKETKREATGGHKRPPRPGSRRRQSSSGGDAVRAEKPTSPVRDDGADPERGGHANPGPGRRR